MTDEEKKLALAAWRDKIKSTRMRPTLAGAGEVLEARHPVQPVPYADWPVTCKLAYAAHHDEDKGVGDTIARLAKKMGAAWMAKEFERVTGKTCGCTDRQAHLNANYPYADASRK